MLLRAAYVLGRASMTPETGGIVAQPALAIVQPRSDRSAAQPASSSTVAQLISKIPRESVLLIVRYVGAHNLETFWRCTDCNPYWYNWYCHECRKFNTFLHWSPRLHYGHCGQSCGCCRWENAECFGGCEACEDLWNLKGTCHTMRDLLKTYSGT